MALYQKKLRIGNICLVVDSVLPFALSRQAVAFEDEFEGCDVRFLMDTKQIFRPEDFSLISSFGLTAMYSRGEEVLKVYYRDKKWKNIGWYAWCSRKNPEEYQVYIAEDWQKYLNKINPLYFCDLSSFLMDHQAIVLHSSLIDTCYGGIVFTAPSGTGKSTQADLWEKYAGAEIINGDRSVIRKENGFRAYGSPYAGSSRIYKNQFVDLRAIVVLRQAPWNKIRKLRGREAYLCLASETSISAWNKQIVEQQTNFLLDLLGNVPAYLLECLPDEGAVRTLERVLRGEENGTK